MSQSDPSNVVSISFSVSAQGEVALIQALLDRVVALTEAENGGDGSSRALIGFRSVAPDLATLAVRTIEDAYGEADAQGACVARADVSGVMPIDEGWRSWGFVGIEPILAPVRTPIVVGVPSVHREGRIITMTVSIRIEGGEHDR